MSAAHVRAKPLVQRDDRKADLVAMLAGLDELLDWWDHGTNPLFHSAAGQVRKAVRDARPLRYDEDPR